MTLSDIILSKLGRHVGREQAIKRRDLLQYLHDLGHEITDREMRAIIEQVPLICSGSGGYYLAKTAEDYRQAITYIQKKIYPLFEKIKRKEQAYPEFSKPGQMELF